MLTTYRTTPLSLTTAVAAKQLNRNYIGFELIENYVKFAEERILKEIDDIKETLW